MGNVCIIEHPNEFRLFDLQDKIGLKEEIDRRIQADDLESDFE